MVKLPTLLVSAALPDDSRRRQSYCAGLWRRVIAPAGIDTIGADVGQFFPRQNSSLFTFTLVHLGNLDPVEHSLKSTLHTISFSHTPYVIVYQPATLSPWLKPIGASPL